MRLQCGAAQRQFSYLSEAAQDTRVPSTASRHDARPLPRCCPSPYVRTGRDRENATHERAPSSIYSAGTHPTAEWPPEALVVGFPRNASPSAALAQPPRLPKSDTTIVTMPLSHPIPSARCLFRTSSGVECASHHACLPPFVSLGPFSIQPLPPRRAPRSVSPMPSRR